MGKADPFKSRKNYPDDPRGIIVPEVLRRALSLLQIEDVELYRLMVDYLFFEFRVRRLERKYKLSRRTVYRRLERGRTFLRERLSNDEESLLIAKTQRTNIKFPRVAIP